MKILALTALCAFGFSFANATVETYDPNTGTGTIGPGGSVAKRLDEIINEPDDFPTQEEDDGLFFCMLDFYENEDGEIFVIDSEDGSVIRVSDT